jgi:hypothetical protein
MVRKTVLAVLLLFTFLLVSCGENAGEDASGSSEERSQTDLTIGQYETTTKGNYPSNTKTTTVVATTETTTKPLPTGLEYVPGSIPLLDNDYYGYGVYRPYRLLYYTIPDYICDLVSSDDFNEWAAQHFWGGEKPDKRHEMGMALFVKYFNIPREDFDKAVAIGNSVYSEYINSSEEYEVPNSDVIYTFDNEIINKYYRYE